MTTTINLYETVGNNTWTKPSDSVLVEVIVASGGGGGGSGVHQSSLQGRSGGGSGGGGGVSRIFIRAADLTATVIAQVGAGGNGGARVTTDATPGNPGTAGGDSAFYNGANLYGRSTAGGQGSGGNGGGSPSSGGVGGRGTWDGGVGKAGPASALGVIGDALQWVNMAPAQIAAAGSSGGGIDGAGTGYGGGAGRWSPHVTNGLGHPTNPAGATATSAPANASGVNGLTRSLYGAASGASGGSNGAPGTVPNGVSKGAGGSGGGVTAAGGGTGSGNGGNGGPGAVYVISHGPDIDIRQGSVRSSVAVTASPAGGRRALFSAVARADLTATSLVTSTARRSGSSSAPVAATSLLTHRQGRATAQLTVIGTFRSGPLKGATSVLTVTGTATGSAKRTGAVRSTVAVLGRAQLVRRIAGQVRSPVVVIGTSRGRRYILVTPPVGAQYLDRPTKAHYHQSPTRADYLVVPTRALYDSGVGERIPWMAGQLRGSIRAQLTDANGPLPGLPSALSVRFTARRMEDGLGLVDGFATVEDAANAIVRYDPVPGDFGTPGQYGVQWIVSHSGALPQYVPDDGYDELDCMTPIVASP